MKLIPFERQKGDSTGVFSADGWAVANNPKPDLSSVQEATNTRKNLLCCHLVTTYPSSPGIVVFSFDTDVFVLLCHTRNIKHQVFLDIGTKSKRRLVNITRLAEIHALLGLIQPAAFRE